MQFRLASWTCAVVVAVGSANLVAAENAGQADLDEAFEARLTAQTLPEVGNVIELCRSALKKGLDDDNAKFAKQLLASSLYQRGEVLAHGVLEATRPDPQIAQIRFAALSDLEEAVKNDEQLWPAYVLVARLQMIAGADLRTARARLDKVIDAKGPEPDVRAEALTYRSMLRDKPEDRLADLDAAIKASGSEAQAFRMRAALKLSQNKPEDAVADFDAAIKLEPDHAATYEARGLALASQEKWDEARQSLTRAVELFPQSSGALLQRGRVNLMAGDFEAAIADANQVLKLVPDFNDALQLRSAAKYSSGDKAGALADVNRVLERSPNASQALRTRVAIYVDQQQINEAVADLESLTKLEPASSDVVLQWAALENARRRNRRAVELLDVVIKNEPKNWRAMRLRGDAQLGLGKHHDAVADYEAALKIEPKDAGLLNNLAWVLATSPDDSVRNGERAVELAETACRETEFKEAHILSTLAAGYAERGDFATARKWSNEALKFAKDGEKAGLEKERASYEAEKPWREALSETADAPSTDKK